MGNCVVKNQKPLNSEHIPEPNKSLGIKKQAPSTDSQNLRLNKNAESTPTLHYEQRQSDSSDYEDPNSSDLSEKND